MIGIAILMGISFCTATSLILINKEVMNKYGFECPTFLTSYHFLLGAIFLYCLGKCGFIAFDHTVPHLARWVTAAFGTFSVVFLNLNLKVNSIGFYQLSKLCNIPCMVLYKYIFEKQTTPIESLISLTLLLSGLCLFSVNDVEFTIVGLIIAIIAVVSTTVYQSRATSIQRTYKINGTQYNQVIAFPQFVICFTAALLTETYGKKSIFLHKFQFKEILLILSTGIFACYGNLVAFIALGKIGPVTFQVIGHTKTILVFIFGMIRFPPPQTETLMQKQKKIIGLVISMLGAILYSVFEIRIKQKEMRQKEKDVDNASDRNDNMEEEDEKKGIVFEQVLSEEEDKVEKI
ncbi:UDP-xylose transporter 1-like [Histomonas meleagridis]|uniref:UDP-xylose transporter 1-like n=1 Tax=Histomonas meleagridis TaxID=135588 RepID=UPI00355A5DC1|nr:UDP-xylose transporter 1-like [Histomonas meleagridis]KAH0803685.1 UDP-xylose transporter 1-like [Histomonas meleagridis]